MAGRTMPQKREMEEQSRQLIENKRQGWRGGCLASGRAMAGRMMPQKREMEEQSRQLIENRRQGGGGCSDPGYSRSRGRQSRDLFTFAESY